MPCPRLAANPRSLALAALFGAVLGSSAASQDWPEFQGPNRDGTSSQTGLLHEFPAGGPPVRWTTRIEEGFGGAAVRDGEVYLLDCVPSESDVLRVLDADTGEELWRFEHAVPGRLPFPGSRCVPTVTEDMVYAVGGFGHVYCLDRESHEAVWILDLEQEHHGELPMFGFANSPLVVDDLLIVTPMGAEKGLLALDRFTGDEVWTTPGIGSSHSSPVLVELLGRQQILFLSSQIEMPPSNAPQGLSSALPGGSRQQPPPSRPTASPGSGGQEAPESIVGESMADMTMSGKGLLCSYSPEGELLWQSDRFFCSTAIPAPFRVDDRHLFLTGGYKSGSMLVELVEDGDTVELKEVFRIEKGAQVHIPALVDGHLYVLVNENANDPRTRRKEGGLMCLDLAGHEKWRTGDDPYFGRGNLILADGMLIVQDGLSGILNLIDPSPEGYHLLAQAEIFGPSDRRDHQMWAPMALANGRLFMRSQTELKCVDLRAASGE